MFHWVQILERWVFVVDVARGVSVLLGSDTRAMGFRGGCY